MPSTIYKDKNSTKFIFFIILLAFITLNACKDDTVSYNPPTDNDDENTPPPIEVDDIESIDSEFADFMEKYDIKGASVAVTKDGRLVYAKGYGFADVDSEAPVDTSSLFRIASLSKFITSAGVMKLMEEGYLDLDDKVFGADAILGDDYGSGPYPQYVEDITVNHLLHHEIGGWSNSGTDPAFSRTDLNIDELITWAIDNQRISDKPGTKFNYSNLGYMILGKIIEKLSGQNYETYMRDNILKPSGVAHMQIGEGSLAGRKDNEVKYYTQPGLGAYENSGSIQRLGPAGGWIASAIDLTRILVHIDGFDTVPDILKPETVEIMTKPSPISGYAAGLYINANSKNWWHSGGLNGTSTWIVRTPNGYTWSILTNTGGNDGIYTGLNNLIWSAVGDSETNWTEYDLF